MLVQEVAALQQKDHSFEHKGLSGNTSDLIDCTNKELQPEPHLARVGPEGLSTFWTESLLTVYPPAHTNAHIHCDVRQDRL